MEPSASWLRELPAVRSGVQAAGEGALSGLSSPFLPGVKCLDFFRLLLVPMLEMLAGRFNSRIVRGERALLDVASRRARRCGGRQESVESQISVRNEGLVCVQWSV